MNRVQKLHLTIDASEGNWPDFAMAFELEPKLAKGGFALGNIGGCQLLLKNNALFPWLILVPEVEGVEDLHQLDENRFLEVMNAVRHVSEFVESHFSPEKLNVACIGNIVRQMHIHIVGRSTGDPAWPGTVWAHDGKAEYTPDEVEEIRETARVALDLS
jgi:diadenosine tetraphosphate (Ap4A) HIT family hydrolase